MHKLNYASGGGVGTGAGCRCGAGPESLPSTGFTAFLEALAAGLSRHIPPARGAVSPCDFSRHLARDVGWDC